MVTYRCRTCDAEHELSFGSPPYWFWCDDACHDEFMRVVDHLAAGGDPGEIDLDPESRLCSEAFKEVAALRRREATERREVRQREWGRSRPRPMRPLYPV